MSCKRGASCYFCQYRVEEEDKVYCMADKCQYEKKEA